MRQGERVEKRHCLVVRWGLLAVFCISGALLLPGEEPTAFGDAALVGLGVVFVGTFLGTVFLVVMHAANPSSARVWLQPGWGVSPFDVRQPLVMLHFFATLTMAAAAGAGAAFLGSRGRTDLGGAAFFAVVGLGIRLGVAVSGVVCRNKTGITGGRTG
jgi:hypothetical protein